jgi:hypothetical protein
MVGVWLEYALFEVTIKTTMTQLDFMRPSPCFGFGLVLFSVSCLGTVAGSIFTGFAYITDCFSVNLPGKGGRDGQTEISLVSITHLKSSDLSLTRIQGSLTVVPTRKILNPPHLHQVLRVE